MSRFFRKTAHFFNKLYHHPIRDLTIFLERVTNLPHKILDFLLRHGRPC